MSSSGSALSVIECADAPLLCALINDAYAVESGDTGVAFKRAPRFDSPAEIEALLAKGSRCLAAVDTSTGTTVGAIVYQIDGDACFFGPFAVCPSAAGRGVGKLLLAAIEQRAASVPGCVALEMCVINHRTDIIPMYEKWGFARTGTAVYEETWKLTRPAHFINFRRPLQPRAEPMLHVTA
jgi:GNAT superfamily N-acetyltransferase